MLLVLILVLLLAGVLGVFRAILHGTLTLVPVEEVEQLEPVVELPARPWLVLPTDKLIGLPGRIFIVGIPFTRRMHIWIRCPRRPVGEGTLRPGGRRYISGIWITHDPAAGKDELPPDIDLDSIGGLGPGGQSGSESAWSGIPEGWPPSGSGSAGRG
jgi:hypothetical protein